MAATFRLGNEPFIGLAKNSKRQCGVMFPPFIGLLEPEVPAPVPTSSSTASAVDEVDEAIDEVDEAVASSSNEKEDSSYLSPDAPASTTKVVDAVIDAEPKFYADLNAIDYPIVSDHIPFPIHLVQTAPNVDVEIYDSAVDEMAMLESWKAIPIVVPVLGMMLTGKPCRFIASRYDGVRASYEQLFKEHLDKVEKDLTLATPSVLNNVKYRHAMAGMKKWGAQHRLNQYTVEGWAKFQSSFSMCLFYNRIIDIVTMENGFISGYTITPEEFFALKRQADLTYVKVMKELIDSEKDLRRKHKNGIPPNSLKRLVLSLLRAKESWILTVADIPLDLHYLYLSDFGLPQPTLGEIPEALRQTIEAHNKVVEQARTNYLEDQKKHAQEIIAKMNIPGYVNPDDDGAATSGADNEVAASPPTAGTVVGGDVTTPSSEVVPAENEVVVVVEAEEVLPALTSSDDVLHIQVEKENVSPTLVAEEGDDRGSPSPAPFIDV